MGLVNSKCVVGVILNGRILEKLVEYLGGRVIFSVIFFFCSYFCRYRFRYSAEGLGQVLGRKRFRIGEEGWERVELGVVLVFCRILVECINRFFFCECRSSKELEVFFFIVRWICFLFVVCFFKLMNQIFYFIL